MASFERLLHVIGRLSDLPVTLGHLQSTMVGKIVNSYRYHPTGGEQVKQLIAKWKSLLPATPAAPTVSIKTETISETQYRTGSPKSNPHSTHGRAPYLESSARLKSIKQESVSKEEPSEDTETEENEVRRHESSPSYTALRIKREKDDTEDGSREAQNSRRDHSHDKCSSKNHSDRHNHHHGSYKQGKSDTSRHDKNKDRDSKSIKFKQEHVEAGDGSEQKHKVKKETEQRVKKESDREIEAVSQKEKELKGPEVTHRSKDSVRSHSSGHNTSSKSTLGKSKHSEKSHKDSRHKDKSQSKADPRDRSVGRKDRSKRDDKPICDNTKVSVTGGNEVASKSLRSTEETAEEYDLEQLMDMNSEPSEEGLAEENGGLSFEDMINCDAHLVKKKKKASTLPSRNDQGSGSSSGQSKSSTSSRQTHPKDGASHDKHSSRDKHSHSKKRSHSDRHSNHRSNDRHSSEKSKGNSGDKKDKSSSKHSKTDDSSSRSAGRSDTSKKRKDPPTSSTLDVPVPSKQLKLGEVDIMSTLTNDYRPLPQISEKAADSRKVAETEILDDDEIGSRKYAKKQVYSGRKAVYLSAVPTLFDACLRVLIDNIDSLDVVGGVPYDILKPVLERCTPTQLYGLEDLNSHFLGETDELWEKHTKRDFRGVKPGEFESWRELYLRKHDEREEKLQRLTQSIRGSMVEKAAPVRKTKLAYVDTTAKAPRGVRRAQLKHGTAGPMGKQNPLAKLSSQATPGREQARAPAPHGDPTAAQGREKPKLKIVAPMMAKTMKMMRGLRR